MHGISKELIFAVDVFAVCFLTCLISAGLAILAVDWIRDRTRRRLRSIETMLYENRSDAHYRARAAG